MSILSWMRRRDTRLQKAAYSAAAGLARKDFPIIPGFHALLSAEREFRKGALRHLFAKCYYEPLLRRRVASVGKSLILYEDMPKIFGNLTVELGHRVTLAGAQVWFACGDMSPKLLRIGDDSYVGHGTELFSGSEIVIGRHVLIANYVLLNGYDGHPLDPLARAARCPPPKESYGPIVVSDYAWIGSRAIILKNVRIGRGAVVASGAVVTKDVPDLTVVAGNPAIVVRVIETPIGWQQADGNAALSIP
jgi:acetyltransferase-like isoleucine patch superfamily enzyme